MNLRDAFHAHRFSVVLFFIGAVLLGIALVVAPGASTFGRISDTFAVMIGAGLVGLSFGEGDDEGRL